MTSGETTGAPRRRAASETVLGALGVLMVAAAVVLLLVGGEGDGAAGVGGPVPELRLLQPRDGAGVEPRLEVVFAVEGGIGPIPGGWGRDARHVHLRLDGTELMPGPADIRAEGGHYRWTVGPLRPGRHTLRLLWSGPDHVPLPEGFSRAVTVEVR